MTSPTAKQNFFTCLFSTKTVSLLKTHISTHLEEDSFFHARTIDVFISRLQKYLKDDTTVQIVNIRGIVYKLIPQE